MTSRRTRAHAGDEVEEPSSEAAAEPTTTPDAPDLGAELEASRNRELRLAADFENFRKRAARERLDATEDATARLFERLVPALDDLQRALEHAPAGADEGWLRGIRLAFGKLEEVFTAAGVAPIEAIGNRFDPRLHEAIGSEESDLPEDTIVVELRRGYALGERVLRPSLVKLSAGRAAPSGTH